MVNLDVWIVLLVFIRIYDPLPFVRLVPQVDISMRRVPLNVLPVTLVHMKVVPLQKVVCYVKKENMLMGSLQRVVRYVVLVDIKMWLVPPLVSLVVRVLINLRRVNPLVLYVVQVPIMEVKQQHNVPYVTRVLLLMRMERLYVLAVQLVQVKVLMELLPVSLVNLVQLNRINLNLFVLLVHQVDIRMRLQILLVVHSKLVQPKDDKVQPNVINVKLGNSWIKKVRNNVHFACLVLSKIQMELSPVTNVDSANIKATLVPVIVWIVLLGLIRLRGVRRFVILVQLVPLPTWMVPVPVLLVMRVNLNHYKGLPFVRIVYRVQRIHRRVNRFVRIAPRELFRIRRV
jgi:hypothetical protein